MAGKTTNLKPKERQAPPKAEVGHKPWPTCGRAQEEETLSIIQLRKKNLATILMYC